MADFALACLHSYVKDRASIDPWPQGLATVHCWLRVRQGPLWQAAQPIVAYGSVICNGMQVTASRFLPDNQWAFDLLAWVTDIQPIRGWGRDKLSVDVLRMPVDEMISAFISRLRQAWQAASLEVEDPNPLYDLDFRT